MRLSASLLCVSNLINKTERYVYKRTFIVLVVVSQSHVFYLADQTQVWMSTAEAAGAYTQKMMTELCLEIGSS